MKKLLLSLVLLAAAVTLFYALHLCTSRLSSQAAFLAQGWNEQSQQLAQARLQLTVTEERVRTLKHNLAAEPAPVPAAAPPSLTANLDNLTPEQTEKLLAELGFDWESTGSYLVISKNTLHHLSVDAVRGVKLTDVVCQVLAIAPEERAALEAMTQRLGADFKAWAETHVQRDEPTGNVVAKYTLPTDPAFSLSLSNTFTSGVTATLGAERSALFLNYAGSWMSDLGMYGGDPVSMVVKRYNAGGETHLGLEVRSGHGSMSTDVTPHQPVPEAFRLMFPNGWPDLAAREGFDLPKSFSQSAQDPLPATSATSQ